MVTDGSIDFFSSNKQADNRITTIEKMIRRFLICPPQFLFLCMLKDAICKMPNVLFSRRASGSAFKPLTNITNFCISRRGCSEQKRGRLECGLGCPCLEGISCLLMVLLQKAQISQLGLTSSFPQDTSNTYVFHPLYVERFSSLRGQSQMP
jgi:hypothetical protein